MASTYGWDPTALNNPSLEDLFGIGNQGYMSQGGKFGPNARALGTAGAKVQGAYGIAAQKVGLSSLLKNLLNEGRVDPRLLARAQAQSSMQTQQQLGAQQAMSSRSGMSGSGLNKAMQAAISSAGANRSANLNYQDIADSYGRQQQNLGLLNQLSIQPSRDYAAIGAGQYSNDQQKQGATVAAIGSLLGAILCKVAKELYGEDDPRFHNARKYVMTSIPADVATKYAMHGDELVAASRSDEKVRERLRPIFDKLASRGAALGA